MGANSSRNESGRQEESKIESSMEGVTELVPDPAAKNLDNSFMEMEVDDVEPPPKDANEPRLPDKVESSINRMEIASSVHQATTYCCLMEHDSPNRKKIWTRCLFLFLSYTLVYLQAAVAAAINYGASKPICIDNEGCPLGWWCDPKKSRCMECDEAWNSERGGADMCFGMMESNLDMMWMMDKRARHWTGRTGGKEGMPTPKQREYMCDACEASKRIENTGNLEPEFFDIPTVFKKRFDANRFYDWATLVLASLVVALAAFSEIKDILLCDFWIWHTSNYQGLTAWRIAIKFLGILRQYVFLPILVQSVSSLVVTQGGDAINVCLNAVAVLFIAELDNAMFEHGIDYSLKEEVQDKGKVPVGPNEANALEILRVYYQLSIPACIIATVMAAKYEEQTSDGFAFMDVSLYTSFSAFAGGAAIESIVKCNFDLRMCVHELFYQLVYAAIGMGALMLVTLKLPVSPLCEWGLFGSC